MLTDEQAKILIQHLHLWLDRLDRENHAVPGHMTRVLREFAIAWRGDEAARRNPVERAFDDGFFSAYLIAVALRRIEDHVRLLRSRWSGDFARYGTEFMRVFEECGIKDLRDLLEHSADYVAKCGRRLDLVLDAERGPAFELDSSGTGVRTIRTFGREFLVEPAIGAALALEKPSRRWRDSLS